MGSMPFEESFIIETLQEDYNTIINLLMLANPHVTFMMFSFCYV